MQRNHSPGWMRFPAWVGHATSGLLAGAIIGYMTFPYLQSSVLFARFIRIDPGASLLVGPVLGGVIGVIVGVITGMLAERRGAARTDRLGEGASRIGAQFSPHDAELEESLRSDFPERVLSVQNVLRKDLVGLRLSIGDLSLAESSGEKRRAVLQTAAVYRRADLALPGFRLQPASLMTKLLSAGTSVQGMRFPEQPDFEKRYFVMATHVTGTRALLGAPVLSWLAAHPGLHVDAGGHTVILYRRGTLLRPEELDPFVREAAEFLRLIEQSARQAGLQPDAPLATQEEVRAFVAQMPASMASSLEKRMRARLVTREDVDAFLRQDPPRKIPPNLAHRYQGVGVVVLVGAMFAAVGGPLAAASVVSGQWGGAAFSLLFLIAGVAMLFFAGRSWWRQRELLRRGEIAVAQIQSVNAAGWSDEEGEAFEVCARYPAGGRENEGRGTVQGAAAGRVKRLAAEGKTAPILFDARHRERIVLIDALINAEKG